MSDERAHDTASESKTSDGNLAAPDVANDESGENDPVFAQEQQHLSDTYATLQSMAGALAAKMRKNEDAAAATKQQMVEEIKQKQRISGFNSIFAVSSVPMAKLYYQEFKKQMAEVYTTSVNKATLDECPMAYKGMQDILDNIGPTADVVKVIRPIYNFKAGDEE